MSESSFGVYVCLRRPAGLHRNQRSCSNGLFTQVLLQPPILTQNNIVVPYLIFTSICSILFSMLDTSGDFFNIRKTLFPLLFLFLQLKRKRMRGELSKSGKKWPRYRLPKFVDCPTFLQPAVYIGYWIDGTQAGRRPIGHTCVSRRLHPCAIIRPLRFMYASTCAIDRPVTFGIHSRYNRHPFQERKEPNFLNSRS